MFNSFIPIVTQWDNCILLASAVNTPEKGVTFPYGQEGKPWIFPMSFESVLDHSDLFSCSRGASRICGEWCKKMEEKESTCLSFTIVRG